MNILITGANGQLGTEMKNLLSEDSINNSFFTDKDELDITDLKAIDNFIKTNSITHIVNCAAYTAVDKAEDDLILCSKLNIDAVSNLVSAAQSNDCKLIHISTDYVFDGKNYHPYKEDDKTDPQSVYGTTKLEGERLITDNMKDTAIIIRTSWLYSPYGHNFVKTMINLGKEKGSINVVSDQIGTPTYAKDLAKAIILILKAPEWKAGTYHFSNEGAISWYDFTKAIHRIAGIKNCKVNPIASHNYITPAKRPFYSVLDKSKIKSTFNFEIPYWEDSLEDCIKQLK